MLHTFIPSALHKAESELERLEQYYGIATSEVLSADPSSPLLDRIDGFDLIEWNFRAEQVACLRVRQQGRSFTYADIDFAPLENLSEPEPALAA